MIVQVEGPAFFIRQLPLRLTLGQLEDAPQTCYSTVPDFWVRPQINAGVLHLRLVRQNGQFLPGTLALMKSEGAVPKW
jgi:hypothetical protein